MHCIILISYSLSHLISLRVILLLNLKSQSRADEKTCDYTPPGLRSALTQTVVLFMLS